MGQPGKAGRVLGLGVAVPGVVHRADGTVRFAASRGWQDAPLGELLRAALAGRNLHRLPVRIANDGDLGVLAEHRRGVARGMDDVVFLEGEAGIGCGPMSQRCRPVAARRRIGWTVWRSTSDSAWPTW